MTILVICECFHLENNILFFFKYTYIFKHKLNEENIGLRVLFKCHRMQEC